MAVVWNDEQVAQPQAGVVWEDDTPSKPGSGIVWDDAAKTTTQQLGDLSVGRQIGAAAARVAGPVLGGLASTAAGLGPIPGAVVGAGAVEPLVEKYIEQRPVNWKEVALEAGTGAIGAPKALKTIGGTVLRSGLAGAGINVAHANIQSMVRDEGVLPLYDNIAPAVLGGVIGAPLGVVTHKANVANIAAQEAADATRAAGQALRNTAPELPLAKPLPSTEQFRANVPPEEWDKLSDLAKLTRTLEGIGVELGGAHAPKPDPNRIEPTIYTGIGTTEGPTLTQKIAGAGQVAAEKVKESRIWTREGWDKATEARRHGWWAKWRPEDKFFGLFDHALSKQERDAKALMRVVDKEFGDPRGWDVAFLLGEAGGDRSRFAAALADEATPESARPLLLRALNASDREYAIAGAVREYFDARGMTALKEGVIANWVQDYIRHSYHGRMDKMPDSTREILEQAQNAELTGQLPEAWLKQGRDGNPTLNPSFARERIINDYVSAMQKGFLPKLTVKELLLRYDASLERTRASRALVGNMVEAKTAGGKHMIIPDFPYHAVKEPPEGGTTFKKILPQVFNPNIDRSEYGRHSSPALQRYYFQMIDPTTNEPRWYIGNAMIHKDLARQWDAKFGKRANWLDSMPMRWVRELSRQGKGTIFFGSPFHENHLRAAMSFHMGLLPEEMKQEVLAKMPDEIRQWAQSTKTWNGIGEAWSHWKATDEFKGMVEDLARGEWWRDLEIHGAKMGGHGSKAMSDDTIGGMWIHKLPKLGPFMKEYSENLFEYKLPYLKYVTSQIVYRRLAAQNTKVRPGLQLSHDQIMAKVADNVNGIFGGQNWEKLGASKTTQTMMGLMALAHDFGFSKARSAAQLANPVLMREQMMAIVLKGAIATWMSARLINMALNNGDSKMDKPFSVVTPSGTPGVGAREIKFRSIFGDILHAYEDSWQFARIRANPIITRPLVALANGRDERGRKIDLAKALEDTARNLSPIPIRAMTDNRGKAWWEGFVDALGLSAREYRSSAEYEAMRKHIEHIPPGEPGERALLRGRLTQQLRKATPEEPSAMAKLFGQESRSSVMGRARGYIQEGRLTQPDAMMAVKRAQQPQLAQSFKNLTIDEQFGVLEKATDDELRMLMPLFRKRLMSPQSGIQTLTARERAAVLERFAPLKERMNP